ncbi:MAG: SAM-dependent methyltransferase [bacterium]
MNGDSAAPAAGFDIPAAAAGFDIAAVGLGIGGARQVTAEAQEILGHCTEILFIDSGYGAEDHLRKLAPRVTSLLPHYQVGGPRLPTYRAMAGAVIAAALDHPPVGFASYGHPLVFCYPTTLVQRAADLLDLRMIMVAGISSLDTLFVDLNLDFSADGLQMYDATDLVLRRRPLQTDVPCVLWQTTSFGDSTYRRETVPVEDLLPLQEYLLTFYPPEHEAQVVLSATHPALQSIVESYPIGALAAGLATGSQSGTLFIPAISRRPVVDHELARRLAAAGGNGSAARS